MWQALLIGGLVCLHATAQTLPDRERAVLHAEERLYTAVAEAGTDVTDVLDELLSADFTGVETSGRPFNKARWISNYRDIAMDPVRKEGWIKAIGEYSTQERRIRIYDDLAVVTGWRKREDAGHRFMHVWVFQQGKWRLEVSQSTMVFPLGPRPR